VSEILTIEENKIRVTGLDALNGKPILDIKSCEEHFDSPMGLKGIKGYMPHDVQSGTSGTLAANQRCAVAVDKNDRTVNRCEKSGQFSKLRALNFSTNRIIWSSSHRAHPQR
jgi:hypothetical protein